MPLPFERPLRHVDPPHVNPDDIYGEVETDVLGFMMESIYERRDPPRFHRELIPI